MAGKPGTWSPSGAAPPANIAAMTGITPLSWVSGPVNNAPWTSGQRMVLGDATLTCWSGTNWVGGAAP